MSRIAENMLEQEPQFAEACRPAQPFESERIVSQPQFDLRTVSAAVRKLGGEIHLQQKESSASLEQSGILSPHDLDSYLMHFSYFRNELKGFAPAESVETIKERASIEQLAAEMFENTRNWVKRAEQGIDSTEMQQATREYFSNLNRLYSELNCITVLSHIPAAKSVQLSLVEFDTEFSGIPANLLTEIVNLEEELVIDPNLASPQEGFAGVESIEQLQQILARRQSRLYATFTNQTLSGFDIPIFNSESSKQLLREVYPQLIEQGVLDAAAKVGWIDIVGISSKNRLSNFRQGINLYNLLDGVVMEGARAEGLHFLIGAVREGINANTAIKAHCRVGWQPTDIVFLGANKVTPYRVLIRSVDYEGTSWNPDTHQRPLLGEGSHFVKPHGARSLSDASVESAPAIQNSTATDRCKRYFAEFPAAPPQIETSQGGHGYYICIKDQGGYSHHNLIQIRPRTDYWDYRNPLGSDATGSLEEILPLVARSMGYRADPSDLDFLCDF